MLVEVVVIVEVVAAVVVIVIVMLLVGMRHIAACRLLTDQPVYKSMHVCNVYVGI